jgi:hypothetical protein
MVEWSAKANRSSSPGNNGVLETQEEITLQDFILARLMRHPIT